MAERRRPPRTLEEAHRWARRNGSIGFKDAALLEKLRLQADETGVVHVGCGYGVFAITTDRVLSSLPGCTAKVVGIDHCQPLLDLADGVLSNEVMRRGASVRDRVEFRNMDAFSFGNQANVDTIQALFPRGISTIVVMDVFEDLNDPTTIQAVRNLTALLRRGGRMVLGVYKQPRCSGAAHFVHMSETPPRLVGIVNFATPEFEDCAEEEVCGLCHRIAGTGSTGARVTIRNIDCLWMGIVWRRFALCDPDDPDNPPGIRVNDEAHLNPADGRFHHTATPKVMYIDTPEGYCRGAIRTIMSYMNGPQDPEEHRRWSRNTWYELFRSFLGPNGLINLEMLFQQWRNRHDDGPRPQNAAGSGQLARTVITDAPPGSIGTDMLAEWNDFYLTPSSVLVTFRRV